MNPIEQTEDAVYRLLETEGLLRDAGLDHSRIGTHLRAELHALGAFYGVAYFVAAEEVFVTSPNRGEAEDARRRLWEQVCGRDTFEFKPRKNLYLFIVGAPEVIDDPMHASVRTQVVNDDRNYALKRVVTPQQAMGWLANPFVVLEGEARAAPRPELHIRLEMHEWTGASPAQQEQAQLRPSRVLNYLALEDRYDVPGVATRGTAAFWDQVDLVFKRLMGLEYGLVREASGNLRIAHKGNPPGAPLWQASKGERLGFALAHFLTEAAHDVKPGLCIGIHDVLSGFDTLRQLVALDVIRDFAIATGASIQLKSVKSGIRHFAQAKFDLLDPAPAG